MEKMDDVENKIYSEENTSNILSDDSKLRRKLLDDFINTTDEKMKVYLRIRPLGASYITSNNDQNYLHIQDDNTVIMRAPKDSIVFRSNSHDISKLQQKFVFTHVCGPEVGQSEFFNLTMNTPMKEFIDGQNWLIFAYGITNSGKSYTIKGTKSQPGIIPRSINVLFSNLEGNLLQTPMYKPHSFADVVHLTEKDQMQELAIKDSLIGHYRNKEDTDDSSSYSSLMKNDSAHSSAYSDDTFSTTCTFKDQEDISGVQIKIQANNNTLNESSNVAYAIWISFLEVYNENIFDLLVPLTTQKRTKLHLAQDKNGNTHVKGLCEVFVSSAEEAFQLLKLGQKNLRIASTKLNHQSSRSHSIFNIKIVRVFNIENTQTARINSLSFCDLAGSERCTKTKNSGERLKEAGNINTSLMVLGRCITGLRHNQINKNRVVPFRDSKLTRIFQSFFTGKGQAAMIVNVNMCVSMFDETMNVMKFSAIANQVITMDYETSLSVSSKIVARLTELWTRSSRNWSSIGKARNQKDSVVTVDESFIIQEEMEEKAQSDNEIYEELVNLVKYLEKELIEAKQQISTMETEIRAEVCEEYSELMAEMEEAYRENARKAEESAEEYMENRIKLLEKAMNKSGHNNNQVDESDSDDSSSDEEAGKSNDTLNQHKIVDKELEEKSPIRMLHQTQEIQKKLEQAEEEIKKQESIIMKAGELFTEKETEIDNLKSTITKNCEKIASQSEEMASLKKHLKESQSNYEAANHIIDEKEKEKAVLKNKLKVLEDKEQGSLSRDDSLKHSSVELQTKVKELEKEKIEIQNEFDNLKREFEINKLVNMNQVAQMRLESSQNERICTELKQKLSENSAEVDIAKQRCQEYKNTIEEKINEITDLKNRLLNSQSLTEEIQREIQILHDKTNELNSELMAKNSKILALSSKLSVVESECEKMKAINKEFESSVGMKIKCNTIKLDKNNERDISGDKEQNDNQYLQTIENKIDSGGHNVAEKYDTVVQTENDLIESKHSVFEESTRDLPLTSVNESTCNFDVEEQINFLNSDEDVTSDETVSDVERRKDNLAQELENAIIDLAASNERNNLLQNEVEHLRNEKERFSILLSKAEQHLRLMLYSNEKDVSSLVQEMCTKWKAINNLTVSLEKQLLFVTDEFKFLDEKHKRETKNLRVELERKMEEFDALKKSIDEKVEFSNNKMAVELKNKIEELKEALNKSEEYSNILKIENARTLLELKDAKKKEELFFSLKTTLQEKLNEIENSKNIMINDVKERENVYQTLDASVREKDELNNDDNCLEEKETTSILQREIQKLQLGIIKYVQEKSVENETLSALNKNLGALETEKNSFIEERDLLNKEIDKLTKETQKLQAERERYIQMVNAADEELDNSKKKLQTLEEEKYDIQMQISISSKELAAHLKEIENLNQERVLSDTKINTLTQELNYCKIEIEKLEREKADLNTKIRFSNEKTEVFKNKIEKLEDEHLRSVEEINAVNKELDCCRKEIDKLKEERTYFKENISIVNNELDTYKKKIEVLEEENFNSLEKVNVSNTELEDLRKNILKLEEEKLNLMKNITIANENLENCRKKIQQSQEENLSSVQKVTLNKELNDLREFIDKDEDERALSVTEINNLREELNIAKCRLDEMNKVKKEIEAIKDECARLSKELEEKEANLRDLNLQFVLADEKRQCSENKLLSCINEKQELEKRLTISNKEAKALSDILTSRLKDVSEEIETWKNECNRLILTVEEKENANSKLKTDLEESELKLQQLEETMAEKYDKEFVELLQEQIQKKDAKLAMCTCKNEQEIVENIESNKELLTQDMKDITNIKEEKEIKPQSEKNRPQRSQKTRGRGKKRPSTESADYENDDGEYTASKANYNKRRTTKGAKYQKQASPSPEDEDFVMPAKRQTRQTQKETKKDEMCSLKKEDEKMSPLKRVGDYLKEKSPVLGAMKQLIRNTMTGNCETNQLPAKPQERRRRKPLFSTDNMEAQLFDASSPQEEKNPHTIVTRQLRNRQRKK